MRYWELAADVVDVDVGQAALSGVGHLGVVVDGDVTVEDLLEEVFIVGNGEVLHGQGSGRQAGSVLSNAQGGGSIADLVPGAIVHLGDRPLGSIAQALHSGGDDGLGLAGLVDVDADDLAVLSAHGAYYTYEYGWLWKKQATAPIILLLEKSDFWNDLRYGLELLSHRVIKVNGCYAVTGDFFGNAYRGGKLNGTIVLSETCEFYGRSGHVDTALSDGLLSGGAKAVAGFVNNVDSVYSRSMLWATVNRLIEGETLQQAIDYGLEVYGENDIVWYLNQNTGRRPHAAASYPIIQGDGTARLTAPGTATNSAAEQQPPAAA